MCRLHCHAYNHAVFAGMWMNVKAESKFTDHVHAVAVLPGCAAAVGLAEHGTLIAAVGRRLVAFSERLTNEHMGHFQKHHLIATAQPITCLSPSASTKGEWRSIQLWHWRCPSRGRPGACMARESKLYKQSRRFDCSVLKLVLRPSRIGVTTSCFPAPKKHETGAVQLQHTQV